jgi:hypothetical protein
VLEQQLQAAVPQLKTPPKPRKTPHQVILHKKKRKPYLKMLPTREREM